MWNVFGASYPSPYHTHGENQDYSGFTQVGDVHLIVVADGAGSCPSSRVGAEYAVNRTISLFKNDYHMRDVTVDTVSALTTQVRADFLETFGEDHKAYSCTFTVTIFTADRWASATIGDAFSIVFDATGGYTYVSDDSGEYVNETVFLNSKGASPTVAEGVDPVFVAAATDGLKNVALENNVPFMGFWGGVQEVFTEQAHVEQLFTDMAAKSRVVDDTTLVCATVRGGGNDETHC